MDKVIEKAYKLKNAMDIDPRFIKLNDIEKKMENDSEVIRLSYKKDLLEDRYNDALRHFDKESKEVKDAQHELYLAKKELESHPLVREYLSSYQEVRLIIETINDTLFSDLYIKECNKCE